MGDVVNFPFLPMRDEKGIALDKLSKLALVEAVRTILHGWEAAGQKITEEFTKSHELRFTVQATAIQWLKDTAAEMEANLSPPSNAVEREVLKALADR